MILKHDISKAVATTLTGWGFFFYFYYYFNLKTARE